MKFGSPQSSLRLFIALKVSGTDSRHSQEKCGQQATDSFGCFDFGLDAEPIDDRHQWTLKLY